MSKKPNRRRGEHYVIGVDLGVAMQPTAIAVVKQEVVDMIRRGREVSSIQLVYLERLPLDASYAAVIEAVKRILEEVKDKEQDSWRGQPRTDVVVDITGTGRAVGELMEKAGLKPIFVTMTGGNTESRPSYNDRRLAKSFLIGNLLTLFQNPDTRFKVANALPLAGKLEDELQRFSLNPITLNSNDPEAWRENPDDDLVFALALATWWAKEYLPKPPAMRDRENRRIEESYREMDASHRMRIGRRGSRIAEVREDGAVLRRTWNR
jgi:hypothetical protein